MLSHPGVLININRRKAGVCLWHYKKQSDLYTNPATSPSPNIFPCPLISKGWTVFFPFLITRSWCYLVISLTCNYTETQWYSRPCLFVLVKLPLILQAIERDWERPLSHTQTHTDTHHFLSLILYVYTVCPQPSGYTYFIIKLWLKTQRKRIFSNIHVIQSAPVSSTKVNEQVSIKNVQGLPQSSCTENNVCASNQFANKVSIFKGSRSQESMRSNPTSASICYCVLVQDGELILAPGLLSWAYMEVRGTFRSEINYLHTGSLIFYYIAHCIAQAVKAEHRLLWMPWSYLYVGVS